MFSSDERERYARHIMLKEIGGAGQQRLRASIVTIVGMGGLGAPAALYLAAAGVGRLRLIDDDVVSVSNLQRQVLFQNTDVSKLKVEAALDNLRAVNPHTLIEKKPFRLKSENAIGLLQESSLVLDGTDDFATRFAVNAACHRLRAPLVSGAVGRWSGQVAVFKSGLTKHLPVETRSPCYQCFVPEAPPGAETCAQVGIVGALTGVIGSMMAIEAIKEITEAGESLAGRVLFYDGLAASVRTAALKADPACPICGKA